ncbi:MAG: hypothetical protein IPF54_02900 [Draconibacterium sp.]|nr:hypothetical protein [Draconibacterium sp.]
MIDSIPYHIKLNYIYQTTPEITVTNDNDSVIFYGEKEIPFKNPVDGTESTIVVSDHFRYPVFEMMKNYSPKISVFEAYKNFDTGVTTSIGKESRNSSYQRPCNFGNPKSLPVKT